MPALSAATISGTVVAREGNKLVPVARAEVIARESGSSEVAAVARTDRDGRFLIAGLETPKVVLSVQKARYFTASINGREDENITLDCTNPADCSGIQFVLGLGGVVNGMVRDQFGEPVGSVFVSANAPANGQQERRPFPAQRSAHDATDERGYFRLYGLKPGTYVLEAEQPQRGPMATGFKSDPVEIEVEEGGEVNGVLLTGRTADNSRQFSVSGKVTGVDLETGGTGMLMVQFIDLRSRWGGFATGSSVQADGSFTLSNLAAGRYAFHFMPRIGMGMINREDAVPLGVIEVESDLSGLMLKPLPPTGFSGALQFESAGGPEQVQITASSRDGLRPFTALAKAPDYRFAMTNLIPGTYNLSIGLTSRGRGRVRGLGRQGPEYFIRGVRRGSDLAPAREIELTEGKVEEVQLVVSNEFSRVSGRVKAAPGETGGTIRKGSQFQVGLSGPSGYRAVQADQNGRFNFDRVVPGDYRICAWEASDAQAIYDDKTWTAAGDAVRKFSVDPGSEVEIDLTAVP